MAGSADDRTSAAAPPTELMLGSERVYLADVAMLRIYDLLARLARGDMSVLLHGETGTGKELAALQLHHASARTGPLVTINCAALPESLVESELFGYQKGAFSGATHGKPGLVEAADGGTLFLDEIGDMPFGVQAKLLRVLESRRVLRLGDLRDRSVDVRVVAATHRDLEAEASAGRFRQDLYFRLCGASVWIPPLRERRGELELLAAKFLAQARHRGGRPPATLTQAAWNVLLVHPWPGNVRELKQVIEYAATTALGERIEIEHLPERLWRPAGVAIRAFVATAVSPTAAPPTTAPLPPTVATATPLGSELRALERQRMHSALVATGGNQSKAAVVVGMPRRTFVRKLKRYGLGRRGATGV
jgi:DNA-binding NtrC family response regulator